MSGSYAGQELVKSKGNLSKKMSLEFVSNVVSSEGASVSHSVDHTVAAEVQSGCA